MNQSLAEIDDQAQTQSFLENVSNDQLLEYIHDMASELETLSQEKGLRAIAKIMSLAKYEAERQRRAEKV